MQTWEGLITPGADNVGRAHEMLLEAFAEIRQHRAMVKRLEEWAVQMEGGDMLGKFQARLLRNRIKGE